MVLQKFEEVQVCKFFSKFNDEIFVSEILNFDFFLLLFFISNDFSRVFGTIILRDSSPFFQHNPFSDCDMTIITNQVTLFFLVSGFKQPLFILSSFYFVFQRRWQFFNSYPFLEFESWCALFSNPFNLFPVIFCFLCDNYSSSIRISVLCHLHLTVWLITWRSKEGRWLSLNLSET